MTQKKAVTLVTPQALSASQKREMILLLQQKIGDVTPKYLVDPKIIGGLKITIDGQEIDGSLVGEIRKLRSQLPNVVITTAVALTDAEETKIRFIVNKKVGPAQYTTIVDPTVLGGIKMVIDNQEYDGTLRAKLQILRKTLLKKIAA